MKILFDTSVLIAAIVESHPMHSRALPWLQQVKAEKSTDNFLVAGHTLAELYAVLTTLPLQPRISSLAAWRLIHDNIETSARIISLSSSDYRDTIRQMSELGLTGGIIYDALIAKAAKKSHVQCLLTFNYDDFVHVWPDGEKIIQVP